VVGAPARESPPGEDHMVFLGARGIDMGDRGSSFQGLELKLTLVCPFVPRSLVAPSKQGVGGLTTNA